MRTAHGWRVKFLLAVLIGLLSIPSAGFFLPTQTVYAAAPPGCYTQSGSNYTKDPDSSCASDRYNPTINCYVKNTQIASAGYAPTDCSRITLPAGPPPTLFNTLPSDLERAKVWSEISLLASGKCTSKTAFNTEALTSGRWFGGGAEPVGFHVDPSDGKLDCDNENGWFTHLIRAAGYQDYSEFVTKGIVVRGNTGNYNFNMNRLVSQLAQDIFGSSSIPATPDYLKYFLTYYAFTNSAACQAAPAPPKGTDAYTRLVNGQGGTPVNIYVYDGSTGNASSVEYIYGVEDDHQETDFFAVGFRSGLTGGGDGNVQCRTMADALKNSALAEAMAKWVQDSNEAGLNNGAGTGGSAVSQPELTCDFKFKNPATWIFCPIIDGAQETVKSLDSSITALLNIDVNRYFGTAGGCQKGQESGCYYQAWSVMRNVAVAILLIAALVMVASQAAGFSFLDAYTIKKLLPRVLLGAIGITLSWAIIVFLITFFNDLGNAIRNIIYAPFTSFGAIQVSGWVSGAGSIVLVGGFVALGILGVLSLMVTALLAVFMGFALLVFRQIAIIFLAIMAPLAIAMYILPNTEKIWKFWWGSFIKALLMFPILAAFIALGRVFSQVSAGSGISGVSGTVANVIALIAYFAPYFLIPYTFKLAGGTIATIAGIANDRGRGAFDRLRKFRQQQPGKRYDAWKKGEIYKDGLVFNASHRTPMGAFARLAQGTGRRAGYGVKGRFGLTGQGQSRAAAIEQARIAETQKNNPLLGVLANDDPSMLLMAESHGTERGLQAATERLRAEGVAESEIKRRTDQVRAVGLSQNNAAAALDLVTKNKSRGVAAGDWQRIVDIANGIAGGNTSLANGLLYSAAYNSRNAGRLDLGGHVQDIAGASLNPEAQNNANNLSSALVGYEIEGERLNADAARETALNAAGVLDGFKRGGTGAILGGHDSQYAAFSTVAQMAGSDQVLRAEGTHAVRLDVAKQVLEMQKNLSNPQLSGSGRDQINRMMEDLGLDTSAPDFAEQVSSRFGLTTAAFGGQQLAADSRVWDQPGGDPRTRLGGE